MRLEPNYQKWQSLDTNNRPLWLYGIKSLTLNQLRTNLTLIKMVSLKLETSINSAVQK